MWRRKVAKTDSSSAWTKASKPNPYTRDSYLDLGLYFDTCHDYWEALGRPMMIPGEDTADTNPERSKAKQKLKVYLSGCDGKHVRPECPDLAAIQFSSSILNLTAVLLIPKYSDK